jgi:hypothetical protein
VLWHLLRKETVVCRITGPSMLAADTPVDGNKPVSDTLADGRLWSVMQKCWSLAASSWVPPRCYSDDEVQQQITSEKHTPEAPVSGG